MGSQVTMRLKNPSSRNDQWSMLMHRTYAVLKTHMNYP